jgi:hypothetical protein
LVDRKSEEANNSAPEADATMRNRDVHSGSDEPPAKKARLGGTSDSEQVRDARDRGIAPIKAEYVTFSECQLVK